MELRETTGPAPTAAMAGNHSFPALDVLAMRDIASTGAARLVGRDADLARLRSFAAAADGNVLLATGEPGIGKTALLENTAADAQTTGHRVLRAAGVQFAGHIGFGGLNQLLLPLQPLLPQLSDASRQALSVALGGGGGSSAGPAGGLLVLASSALALVSLAADRRPVLLVIDDLHWLDRPSALILGLMARRLGGTRIGLLAGLRRDAVSYFDMTGLPEHALQPISDRNAASLLASRFPDLVPQVLQRLLAEAAGNPLALLELPAALTSSQRTGAAPLPPVLPAGERIRRLFAPRIAALPRRTRQALLMLALEETGDLRVVHELLSAAGPSPHGLDLLAPAEHAGLVRIDESAGQVSFRHPLIRSATVELLASDDRRRAHQALARALAGQPDRQAWHLACAATGPDEKTASLLASAASRAVHRGDTAGAVTALTLAADLSPRSSDRAGRLAEAAYIAGDVTGELRRAPQLLAAAMQADPELSGTLKAVAASSFVLLIGDGDVTTAHRLLVAAVKAGDHGYDAGNSELVETLWTLMMVCFFSGRPES